MGIMDWSNPWLIGGIFTFLILWQNNSKKIEIEKLVEETNDKITELEEKLEKIEYDILDLKNDEDQPDDDSWPDD